VSGLFGDEENPGRIPKPRVSRAAWLLYEEIKSEGLWSEEGRRAENKRELVQLYLARLIEARTDRGRVKIWRVICD
jgi:hypothetical protein